MQPNKSPSLAEKKSGLLDLVLGAGGSRAILACLGVILALWLAGLRRFRTISGTSGGSIPGVMLAHGIHPTVIAQKVIEVDFQSKLTRRVNWLAVWWAMFKKNCLWKHRVESGVFDSTPLGEYVREIVPVFPPNFWTVAVQGERTLLFSADGVWQLHADGSLTEVSGKRGPAPIDVAIRAACAVPGIIDGVDYDIDGETGSADGEDKEPRLLDGALAVGRCPTVLAKRYLNAQPGSIIACDVGEEDPTTASREHWFWRALRWIVCGPCCDPDPGIKTDDEGVLMIVPTIPNMQSLDFKLTRDQKWQVIMSGFSEAVKELSRAGLLTGEKLTQAQDIVATYDQLARTAEAPGELTARTETLMRAAGLF